MTTPVNNLLIDGNAIMYPYLFSYKDENVENIFKGATSNLFYKIQFLYFKYNIDNIIIVFDGGKSWRKIFTSNANPNLITHKKYKDGRDDNKTQAEKDRMNEYNEKLSLLSEFLTTQTRILCLQAKYLEGDDLIAGYIHKFPNDNHIIYSSDKDFLQLINKFPGKVTLVTTDGSERSLEEWNNDPDLFLFEKCFRGEDRAKDNVQSAYPRIRQKEIFKAYVDESIKVNIMKHEFVVEEIVNNELISHKYKTEDLFKENKILMGLSHQPEPIKKLINSVIDEALNNTKSFDIMKFMRFCTNNDMHDVIKDKDKFIKLFTKNHVPSRL